MSHTFTGTIAAPVIVGADKSDVFLVRHGYSEFNALHSQMKNDQGVADHKSQVWFDLKSNPDLCDPNLHEIGVQQCAENAHQVHALNVTRIFVSPMQRALQTCIHMFKNHPNKSTLKITVMPLVHEYFHTSNDIPADVELVLKKYAPGESICEGLLFDFSALLECAIPQLWCVYALTNVER